MNLPAIEPRSTALMLGLFAALLGASVLAGWAFDVPFLRSAIRTTVPMKANAALGILLCATSLAFLSLENNSKAIRGATTIAASGAVALGALTLGEDIVDADLGIDQLLFPDKGDGAQPSFPGRMSPPTAICLMLTGIAMTIASRPIPRRLRLPLLSGLAAAVVIVGGMALVGHALGALTDIRLLNYARMATYTAAGFLLLGCGLLALARGERRREPSLGHRLRQRAPRSARAQSL